MKRKRRKGINFYKKKRNKLIEKIKFETVNDEIKKFYLKNLNNVTFCEIKQKFIKSKIKIFNFEQIQKKYLKRVSELNKCPSMCCVAESDFEIFISPLLDHKKCLICLLKEYTDLFFQNLKNDNNDNNFVNNFCFKVDVDGELKSKMCIGSKYGCFGIFGYLPIYHKKNFVKLSNELRISSQFFYWKFYKFPTINSNATLKFHPTYNDIEINPDEPTKKTYYNCDHGDKTVINTVNSILTRYHKFGNELYLTKLVELFPYIVKMEIGKENVCFKEPIKISYLVDVQAEFMCNEETRTNFESFQNLPLQYKGYLNLLHIFKKKPYSNNNDQKKYSISINVIYKFLRSLRTKNFYDFMLYLPLFSYIWLNFIPNNLKLMRKRNYQSIFPSFGISKFDYIPKDLIYELKFFLYPKRMFNYKNSSIIKICREVIPDFCVGKKIRDKIQKYFSVDDKFRIFLTSCIFCTYFNCYKFKLFKFDLKKLVKFHYRFFNDENWKIKFIKNNVLNDKNVVENIIRENIIWILEQFNIVDLFHKDFVKKIKYNCNVIRNNFWLNRKEKFKKIKKVKKSNIMKELLTAEESIKEEIFEDFMIQQLFRLNNLELLSIDKTISINHYEEVANEFFKYGYLCRSSYKLLSNHPFNLSYEQLKKMNRRTRNILLIIITFAKKKYFIKIKTLGFMEQILQKNSSKKLYFTKYCCDNPRICNIDALNIKTKTYIKKSGVEKLVMDVKKEEDICLDHYNNDNILLKIKNDKEVIKKMDKEIRRYMKLMTKNNKKEMCNIIHYFFGYKYIKHKKIFINNEFKRIYDFDWLITTEDEIKMDKKNYYVPKNLRNRGMVLKDFDFEDEKNFLSNIGDKWKSFFKKHHKSIYLVWKRKIFWKLNKIESVDIVGKYVEFWNGKNDFYVIRLCNICGELKHFDIFFEHICFDCKKNVVNENSVVFFNIKKN